VGVKCFFKNSNDAHKMLAMSNTTEASRAYPLSQSLIMTATKRHYTLSADLFRDGQLAESFRPALCTHKNSYFRSLVAMRKPISTILGMQIEELARLTTIVRPFSNKNEEA